LQEKFTGIAMPLTIADPTVLSLSCMQPRDS
jgi:hypothetical protein